MSYLSANLSALDAVLGTGVRLPEDEGRVRVEVSGPVPVLQLATGGATVALNSRRDPLAEARKVLDAAMAGQPEPMAVVVIGLGLGYVIDAVEQRLPSAKILALEPEPGCVRPMLERRDWSPLISSGRLLLLWGPDYRGSGEGWRVVDGTDDARVSIAHPVLSRHRPDEFAAAAKLVEKMVFGARSNREARKKFAGRYLLNTLRNLPVIARSADAGALFGAFPGVPGIVISAGPSLDRNVEELAAVAGRALLIAVDTALRPLLSAGIRPDLVVAVDPSESNARHLRDLPDTGSTHLVAEGSVAPEAFREFGDRVFTFKVSDHHPWPWLGQHGLGRATLKAWGSVATSAFDLAVECGCNPIVFIGQDLAYSDRAPYCRGTRYEEDWADAVADGVSLPDVWRANRERQSIVEEPDIFGRPVETTASLVAFRDWLAAQISARPDRRFINATGAGILTGPNIEQSPLAALVAPIGARTQEGTR
jgi:hypothetical protein